MTFLYTDYVNGLFDATANVLGAVDVTDMDLILLAVDGTYVADQDGEVSLADVPSGAIISQAAVTGVLVVNRSFTFDPVTFTAVGPGPDIAAAVLVRDTGTDSTSPLIAYLDDAATGLPVVTDGNDVQFNPGAGGIVFL